MVLRSIDITCVCACAQKFGQFQMIEDSKICLNVSQNPDHFTNKRNQKK